MMNKKALYQITKFIKSYAIHGYCDNFITKKESFGYSWIFATKINDRILTYQISLTDYDIKIGYSAKSQDITEYLYLKVQSHFKKIRNDHEKGLISHA